jgi:hypothetical protein
VAAIAAIRPATYGPQSGVPLALSHPTLRRNAYTHLCLPLERGQTSALRAVAAEWSAESRRPIPEAWASGVGRALSRFRQLSNALGGPREASPFASFGRGLE